MEGEATIDVRIVCEEVRKVSRTTLILEAWSEHHDTVVVKIEHHELESDLKEFTKIEVPYQSLMNGLEAVRSILRV
jgi:hypothetical protein